MLLLAGALLLVLLNGFFVAAEFAIVKVRSTRIRELSARGDWRAKIAQSVTSHLDTYLSACQLGITIASLGLGWIGEPAVARLIERPLHALGVWDRGVIHTTALVLAFTIISFLHIVFGEQAPKVLAIRRPEGTSLWCAAPLRLFYWIMYLPIATLNATANVVLRLAGLEPAAESEQAHSHEELRMIVGASHAHGVLNATERRLLENAFDFSERDVAEIMTPRMDMACLYVDRSIAENFAIVREQQHTRYPLAEGTADNIIGMIHVKDFVNVALDGAGRTGTVLQSIKRPILFMPETVTIDVALRTFQSTRTLLAVVVDEHGTAVGLVTLGDMIEELVGPVHDEFDAHEPPEIERRGAETMVDGGLPLSDLFEMFPEIPREFDVEEVRTAGGLVMKELAHVPSVGEAVILGPYHVEVTEMEQRRILRLKIVRAAPRPTGRPAPSPR